MNERIKKNIFKTVLVLLSLAILFWAVVYPFFGGWEIKQVSDILQVKYTGKYLRKLESSKDIKYVSRVHILNRGIITVLIAGTTEEYLFKDFFTLSIDERIANADRDYYDNYQKDTYEQFCKIWAKHISKLNLDIKKIPGSSSDDLWGYACIENDDLTYSFKASYRKSNGSFLVAVTIH